MITDKQRQRDYEYEADYQSKSRYTTEQWANILNSGQLDEKNISLFKQIYSSFNHAATLLQLSFESGRTQEDILLQLNAAGQLLGEANSMNPEVDYEGNEYWWYLFFWGKNTDAKTLELKIHPELTEAISTLYPELEESYYAFMSDVERSLQTRYSQEDAVWIAAAVLLYEKYYCNPGISSDDILLMQYEVQTRSQKVYGQDVNANTITQICNADERGHRFNYLRDIYKYYRVSFPGEFEGERERPDPEEVDYDVYIYSILGYMKLTKLTDFIEHEYAHLVDESYVELTNANGFVRMAAYLSRQGGTPFSEDDSSDKALALRADGEDASETFHKISEALLKEYPNFTYAAKVDWYLPDSSTITNVLQDILYIPSYAGHNAFIGIRTVLDEDKLNIEVSLNLPCVADEEVMLDIHDKCNMLTLMTAAPFQVALVPSESSDLSPSGDKIKAFVLYHYDDFKTMSEEDIVGLFSTSLEIFASYYTDICQNYYPAIEDTGNIRTSDSNNTETNSAIDPLAAALGSKLTYRPATDVPSPQIIYKEGGTPASTDFITKAIQGYGTTPASDERTYENETASNNSSDSSSASDEEDFSSFVNKAALAADDEEAPTRKTGNYSNGNTSVVGAGSSNSSTVSSTATFGAATGTGSSSVTANVSITPESVWPYPDNAIITTHPDRKEQNFRLYPKNTLIKGPVKTGKFHQAIMTAVGIIEGKDSNMMNIEPVPDILEHYQQYVDEGRILHISYPDINSDGYDGFIERKRGPFIEDGIFKQFANKCADGRYVVMMEEVDLNWMHLFRETAVLLRENRREGTSSETAITLPLSKEKFRLPSNLYIVATCDSIVCEDTILGAIDHDFFILPVSPEPEVLHGMRIEGISLQRLMTTINMRLSYFLGADYQLGEGFFLQSPDKDSFISLCRVFREQLVPLLEKWFDGDIERIRYVLGDNGKSRPDTIFFQEIPFRDGLFKGELPDSFDKERRIYRCNEDAFYNPKSYIDIYD
nr:hypothetical protein [uncultured Anaerobutyricum sp.]